MINFDYLRGTATKAKATLYVLFSRNREAAVRRVALRDRPPFGHSSLITRHDNIYDGPAARNAASLCYLLMVDNTTMNLCDRHPVKSDILLRHRLLERI